MKRKFITSLILLAVACLCAFAFTACKQQEMPAPVITTQPSSVAVNYPNGADFTVEVEKPENVLSYQWQEWLKGEDTDYSRAVWEIWTALPQTIKP